MTEIKAEVPMAEMLTYAPDLRAITGGQGDYTMELGPLRGGAGASRAEGDRSVEAEEVTRSKQAAVDRP